MLQKVIKAINVLRFDFAIYNHEFLSESKLFYCESQKYLNIKSV